MTVDLQTGEELEWPIVKQLERQLSELDGLQPGQARSAAVQAAGTMKTPTSTSLVRVGQALAVVSPDAPARWLTRDASRWENAMLDPAARRVAYSAGGDLFVHDIPSGRSLRLTNDGSETLLNGILDWMYQEEIFGRGNYQGFWFSHDGQWLAMLKIDISQIEPYTLAASGSERGSGLVRRYSKAGDPIPHAALVVWDLRQADQGRIPPPVQVVNSTPQQERIVTGVWWYPDRRRLLFSVSDRLQTWRELRSVDEAFLVGRGGQPQRVLREESPAWVEPPETPQFLQDGSLVWRSELPSGRNRLYQIRGDGGVTTPLSPDGFDVEDFFVPPDGSFALVTGDAEGGTVERHAYRIELGPRSSETSIPGDRSDRATSIQAKSIQAEGLQAGERQLGVLRRLTNRAGWNDVTFSPDGQAMVIRHSTPTSPPRLSVAATTTEVSADSALPRVRAGGIELGGADLVVPGGMVEPQLFRIKTADGFDLPAMLIRPPNPVAGKTKTPVVVEVYGGPRSPVVTMRWGGTRSLYREWLARQGIATLLVDNRSSGGRGLADSWAIRHRVGELELTDLLAAVDWLQSQEWVDSDKLAIRGWSFGGFMTLMAMTRSKAFAAGIAGGSVADWREYDSFYTERYMGLPTENEQGYRTTAPIHAAADLHGRLLLIHGEMDDNVHPSNTLRMADALQSAGKQFDLMIYPGAAHSVHTPPQVWHLAQLTDRFLRQHLLGTD